MHSGDKRKAFFFITKNFIILIETWNIHLQVKKKSTSKSSHIKFTSPPNFSPFNLKFFTFVSRYCELNDTGNRPSIARWTKQNEKITRMPLTIPEDARARMHLSERLLLLLPCNIVTYFSLKVARRRSKDARDIEFLYRRPLCAASQACS